MSIKENKNGTTITIYVKPNQASFKVEFDLDEIIVYSTETPERGKVNKEILKEFSKLLSTKVDLVNGATSRKKQIFARGLTKEKVEQLLNH